MAETEDVLVKVVCQHCQRVTIAGLLSALNAKHGIKPPHCVHSTGLGSSIGWTTINDMVCCRCGTRGQETFSRTHPAGHGEYAPYVSVGQLSENLRGECAAPPSQEAGTP